MEVHKSFKILVCGHFGAGKTTFVRVASQTDVVSTERKTTLESEKSIKGYTTTSMDFGELDVGDGYKLMIYGIPGQERFSFMWKLLAKGADGFLFMLDSSDTRMWDQTFKQMDVLLEDPNIPYLILANKQDLPNALDAEEVKRLLKGDQERVVPCVAHDKMSVHEVLNLLLLELKEREVSG
jgi:small GTP-binding protein